ncbi:sec-independent protein translocase protein TatB [Arthrobacter oryzae]|uniref:sec-independent translocase n=1 Tax=Arthrobacter oryzae TaxID=409290 RepID=UPI00277EB10E|nr:sec-independent translocase [Arthrobacter oryzae]MDP9986431.1 sec-independent protein translocase protein TatB [Arthrobacter oryzae]
MFGIDAEKLFVLLIIGALVLGPDKLPEYAAKFGRLIRELRRMASGAQEQLRQELGPEFDDIDWKRLDPRQYDPRRIIREALLDEPADLPRSPDGNERAETGSSPRRQKVVPGQAAPFDSEAT